LDRMAISEKFVHSVQLETYSIALVAAPVSYSYSLAGYTLGCA
jgi:hypothetical protein